MIKILLTALFLTAVQTVYSADGLYGSIYDVRQNEGKVSLVDLVTARDDFHIKIQDSIEIGNTVLAAEVEDFSFVGSPISLPRALRDAGLDIHTSRVLATGGQYDNSSLIEVKEFSGTLLDLFVLCVPKYYSSHAWVIYLDGASAASIAFSGGVTSTSRLSSPEILPKSETIKFPPGTEDPFVKKS